MLRNNVLAGVPADVLENMSRMASDVEACKALAEAGVDVEAIEKKIRKAGFEKNTFGMRLADAEIEGVVGGFEHSDSERDVKCRCGNNDKKLFSYQFFVSTFLSDHDWYRCELCNNYVGVAGGQTLYFLSKEVYDEEVDRTLNFRESL